MQIITEIRDEDLGFEGQEVSEWRERSAARCIVKGGGEVALLEVGEYWIP